MQDGRKIRRLLLCLCKLGCGCYQVRIKLWGIGESESAGETACPTFGHRALEVVAQAVSPAIPIPLPLLCRLIVGSVCAVFM
jgi:hypothetical protein